jgi:hypothetical protein
MSCHASLNSGPHLHVEEGSGTNMCPSASFPASPLGRSPMLPRALWLRIRLSAREGSDAATCSAALDSDSSTRRAPAPPRVPWLFARHRPQE